MYRASDPLEKRLAHFRDLERLGEQITELAAHLDAGEYRFLVLLEAFDREGGWHGTGIRSCAHWLNWRCGVNEGVARENVRVARALPQLPQISAAWRIPTRTARGVTVARSISTPTSRP